MSDCDRVRDHVGVDVQCCDRCHRQNGLTPVVVRGVGEVDICCSVMASLVGRDVVDDVKERLSGLSLTLHEIRKLTTLF